MNIVVVLRNPSVNPDWTDEKQDLTMSDRNVIAEAVQIKEQRKGTVTVLLLAKDNEESRALLKKACTYGADAASLVYLEQFDSSKTAAVAYTAANVIRSKFPNTDLIMFGRLACDGDAVTLATQMSCFLHLPRVTYCKEIIMKNGQIYARKHCSSSEDHVYRLPLPAVVHSIREKGLRKQPGIADIIRTYSEVTIQTIKGDDYLPDFRMCRNEPEHMFEQNTRQQDKRVMTLLNGKDDEESADHLIRLLSSLGITATGEQKSDGGSKPSEEYVLETKDPINLSLFPSTPLCREKAAELCIKTNGQLLTDCIALEVKEGELTGIRPSLDGAGFSYFKFHGNGPWLITMKSMDSVSDLEARLHCKFRKKILTADEMSSLTLVERIQQSGAKTPIKDAAVIFSGGRGIQSADRFAELRALANCYGASVGASRPVVDCGWAQVEEQVGQTGSFVRPQIYLAFGISGAIQHLVGMKDSRVIIAVNKNKNSPVFQYCDYGIYADANSIIRNMLKLLGRKMELEKQDEIII